MTPTSKKQYLIIAAVLVVVIIGVITWFTLRANNKATNLEAAVQALQTAPTFHVKAELLVQLPPRLRNQQRPFTNITARVEGDVQRTSTGTPELTGQLFLGATGPGAEFYADGDLRIFNDQTAFRLDNLSPLFNPTGNLVNKWTYVDAPLLQTRNSPEVAATVTRALNTLSYQGTETINDARLHHVAGSLTPELEEELIAVFNKQVSGNQAYHVLARLLQANDIKKIDIYTDPSSQYPQRVNIVFALPRAGGQAIERATLTLDFSDFGKAVALDHPEQELTVRPDIFGKLFRSGEIEPQ